jgi:hypothetical protein
MFGWKKSVSQHHFFDENSTMALCGTAKYHTSKWREQEFLHEDELDRHMRVCPQCIPLRKRRAISHIKKYHKNVKGFWDDTRVCPNCKSPIIFWNGKNAQEHYCTVCKCITIIE